MKAGQSAAPEKKPRRRVKKAKGHGGHHGGAWKVAYADFVTAMMALFLVLWLVSQADTKLKEQLASYFRNPGVFSSTQGGILSRSSTMSKDPNSQDAEEALMSVAQALRKKFEKSAEFESVKDQIKIEVTEEGLRIQILDKAERVSFDSASADLTAGARAILAEVALAICNLPNPIFIGGHTDRHHFPEGSSYTNWELSADRANAARRHLEKSCVKPDQIRRVIGYADTELLLPEDPYSPANRRISITVSRLILKSKKAGAKSNAEREKNGASGNSSGISSEQQLNKTKLSSEGSVTVGDPDKPPEGVKRSREH